MAKPTKIPLQYPVEMDGAKLEELAMRRPIVRDLRAAQRAAGADALPSDTEVALFANLCEVAPGGVRQVGPRGLLPGAGGLPGFGRQVLIATGLRGIAGGVRPADECG